MVVREQIRNRRGTARLERGDEGGMIGLNISGAREGAFRILI
jgi:hypothetical protein